MAYDEDLSQNRFFVGLQAECPQLYETASSNRFMVSTEKVLLFTGNLVIRYVHQTFEERVIRRFNLSAENPNQV